MLQPAAAAGASLAGNKPLTTAATPQKVQVSASLAKALRVQWEPATGSVYYVIEKSNSQTGPFQKLDSVRHPLQAYRHTGLDFSQKVFYRVRSYNGSTYSGYSPVTAGTTNAKNHTYKVMPLGDSNTEGGGGAVKVEDKAAYRSKLHELFSRTTARIDFVGDQKSGSNLLTDTDHAGFGSATADQLADLLKDRSYGNTKAPVPYKSYLQEFEPEVILLHVGTNAVDSTDAGIARLERILNEVDVYEQTSGKEVTVVLSTIIKRVCDSYCPNPELVPVTDRYNRKIKLLAARRIAAGDRLLLADMAEAGINYSSAGIDMADPLHPNQQGYNKMAGVWYAVLEKVLAAAALPPAAPEQVRVVPSVAGALGIYWKKGSGDEQTYLVETATRQAGPFTELARVAAPVQTFHHAELGHAKTHFYRVRSFNGSQYSEYSTVVKGTTRAAGYTYRIMPLGDSNTHGKVGDLDDKDRVGYRYDLYDLLKTTTARFDFVGGEKSGQNYNTNGRRFDFDHAGFSGARNADLISVLEQGYHFWYGNTDDKRIYSNGPYLEAYPADIILLHIGTNWVDGTAQSKESIHRMLDLVDAYEEKAGQEVTVVLAKILKRVCYDAKAGANFNCYTPEEAAATVLYNQRLAEVAAERIAKGDRIELVDMQDHAGLVYKYPSDGGDMVDNLHPNPSGFRKMAQEWFGALAPMLKADFLQDDIVAFEAGIDNEKVLLTWRTQIEINKSRFIVERKAPGEAAYSAVGTVAAAGTSSLPHTYTFIDEKAPRGVVISYRIRQVSLDNTFKFSVIATVQNGPLSSGVSVQVPKGAVYPNPNRGELVRLDAGGFKFGEHLQLTVVNAVGTEVAREEVTADGAGEVHAGLRFSSRLAPGLYLLQLQDDDHTQVYKFLVN